ncbi:hypothetical protein ACHHYP_03966 [Achlya hypogyna]|uniref:Uncharacterized protein n=1 Tax=Achlya hypogyna TaxID=1202772 RepID=A0A1V9Z2H8_ACHHY|nr:hypothetical protein ACHHYP_03966 [Achlya hypogyna]
MVAADAKAPHAPSFAIKEKISDIYVSEAQEHEIVAYHPVRETLVSVSATSLQEIDVRTGSVLGAIPFDACLGDKPNVFDDLVPVGLHYMVATLPRFLVLWDLKELTLCYVAEITKTNSKTPVVVTAALSSLNTIMFSHEGSQSLKVTTVEGLCSGEVCKKIPRKVTSRNSNISALAFDTHRNVLACGGSDGVVHLWRTGDGTGGSMDDEGSKDEHSKSTGDDVLPPSLSSVSPHALLATLTPKPSAVHTLCFSPNGVLAIGYVNNAIDVFDISCREPYPLASLTSLLPAGLSLYRRRAIHFCPSLNTLGLVLAPTDAPAGASRLVLHRMHFGDGIDSTFGTGLEVAADVAALVVSDGMLALYSSLGAARSLSLLEPSADDVVLANVQPPPFKAWTEQPQFSFAQYCSPDAVPTRILLVTTADSGQPALAYLNLQTNEKCEVSTLPPQFEGLPLVPQRLSAGADGSAAAILLSSTQATVVAVVTVANPGSVPVYEVRDACFTPTHLVSLMPSGRSVRVHGNLLAREADGLLLSLPTPAARIFPTRFPMPNSEACKVVFLTQDANCRECLRLSEHTMAFTLESVAVWTALPHEHVLEVQSEPGKTDHLLAVRTTHRIVVLDAGLRPIAVFAPSAHRLQETPTSVLWVGGAVVFATVGATVRYMAVQTPVTTHLLCTLPTLPPATSMGLVAFLPDRFVYSVVNDDAKAIVMLTRPFSPAEVLAVAQSRKELPVVKLYLSRLLEYGTPLVQPSLKMLEALNDPALALRLLHDGKKAKPGATYRESAHVTAATLSALLLATHRWKDAVMCLVSDDPALHEYAQHPQGSEAQLPPRLSNVATALSELGSTLQALGQLELAGRCFDLAGNDRALLTLVGVQALKTMNSSVAHDVLHSVKGANPQLFAALVAADAAQTPARAKQDLFRRLCTETLVFERRSRLLGQLAGMPQVRLSPVKAAVDTAPTAWKFFTWKRLEPEEPLDWLGTPTPHYSAQEFVKKALHIDTTSDGFGDTRPTPAAATSIGPFLDDEDSVMAYWRFEDAAALGARATDATLLDTSKRENHLVVSPAIELMPSTAPVDRGEDAKLLPAYALRFPAAAPADGADWGATCAVRKGGTMDFGYAFDEDPYRRHLTVESWVKFYADAPPAQAQVLFARTPLWQLSVDASGRLALQLHDRTLACDGGLQLTGGWQHVAFVVDVIAEDKAAVRVTVDGASVLAKEIAIKAVKDATAAIMNVGPRLLGFEITEIRVWATSRSVEQINDMKENYLGIAETKKRIKVAIHQRDCQCEKCLGRRQNTPLAKLAMVQPLAASPSGRTRRVVKAPQSPVPVSPKREETRFN